jgi:hypothetical protein
VVVVGKRKLGELRALKSLEGLREGVDVGCSGRACAECKQANVCGGKVFCGWLRRFVDLSVDDGVEFVVCPRFEVEPLAYKQYRRE